VTVRPARVADVAAILEIEDASFTTDRLTRRKLLHLLARGNCALLVSVTRGRVAGYGLVLFRRGSRSARIYGLAVAPRLRGGGVGRRLLDACESAAAARRCVRVTLEVATANRAAVALYRALGYTRVARLGPYYEDGSAADRYAKRLTACAAG
jgi:[ribosomal protein S18]-alanine N-acetyltransferase